MVLIRHCLLTEFLNPIQEHVVVRGLVMEDDQALYFCWHGAL